MSEFAFPCPACGQAISADTADAGKEVTCPICKATIVVPKEITGGNSTSVGSPPASPNPNASAVQRTSGLAVASLVCSGSSLITCVGWLPGIICGHLARSRIRRNPSLKGRGLATAGLVIGYLILASEIGSTAFYAWRVSTAVKRGYENVRQNLTTNAMIVVKTESATVSNEIQPLEPVQTEVAVTNIQSVEPAESATVATGNQPNNQSFESLASGWTSDISTASFPDHPAGGKLRGIDFAIKSAIFRNGDLRLNSANGMVVDCFRLAASIEGRSYVVRFDDNNMAGPHVRLTWNGQGAVQTATYSKGYGLKLQFDQATNRTVSAKIYLCLPDDLKSCVAGTLQVRLLKPRGQ
jgi:hypothetical protein